MDREQAMAAFLRFLRGLPYGNSLFFPAARHTDPLGLLPEQLVIGVNRNGLHFFRAKPREYLQSIQLRDIMQFGSSSTGECSFGRGVSIWAGSAVFRQGGVSFGMRPPSCLSPHRLQHVSDLRDLAGVRRNMADTGRRLCGMRPTEGFRSLNLRGCCRMTSLLRCLKSSVRYLKSLLRHQSIVREG